MDCKKNHHNYKEQCDCITYLKKRDNEWEEEYKKEQEKRKEEQLNE